MNTQVESSGGTSTALPLPQETESTPQKTPWWRRGQSSGLDSPRQETESTPQKTPWWVRGLTSGGRPVVLLVALLMCAPGEYKLAHLAGWSDPFAYGMPFVLSAYAGIAAAVATTRPRGAPGHHSALWGAVAALSLAIAAQVTSHLLSAEYLAESWGLIAAVSLVPPAVVGHLLHLAASPARKSYETERIPLAGETSALSSSTAVERIPLAGETCALEESTAFSSSTAVEKTGDTRERIIGLWSEGRSAQETADKIGCSKSYVYKVYRELRQDLT